MSTPFVLEDLLESESVVAAYQPIVDLVSGEVVGFEALARWPRFVDAKPAGVISAANAAGRGIELDWSCRLAAMSGALNAGLRSDQVLFVNVEPHALGSPAPEGAVTILERATTSFRVILELTERALLSRPADLLRVIGFARSRGWGIALDDVGAHPDSLALLPFVEPDVIKLDIALVQQTPSLEQARTMAAILAHHERHGTAILAEGIETPRHLEQALTFGARYGQGWLFGKPGPLAPNPVVRPLAVASHALSAPATPYALVDAHPEIRVGRKSIILAMSHHIENQATSLHDPPVVLAAFQSARHFTPKTAARYASLAQTCPLVVAFAQGLQTSPATGVRGAALTADDPLTGEWTVVVVGAHYAGALIARDLGDQVADTDRRFSFMITHDREIVIQAGRSLLSRVQPLPHAC